MSAADPNRHRSRAVAEKRRRLIVRLGGFAVAAGGLWFGVERLFEGDATILKVFMLFIWPILFCCVWFILVKIYDHFATKKRWEVETDEAAIRQAETDARVAKAAGAFDKWEAP